MRVALVDDHPVLRRGVRSLLEQNGIQITGEADDVRGALLLPREEIDVYVIDLGLPGRDGFAALVELLRIAAGTRVLILTMHAREDFAARALQQGATGYALKEQPCAELVEAVTSVARGERYVAPRLRTSRLEALLADGTAHASPLAALSRREREVFDLLARGFTNEAIGTRLFVSPKTIETHRTRIFRKLGIHAIGDLIRLAAREGALL
jgi:DNA-binding NarL/FixJ family response regulator